MASSYTNLLSYLLWPFVLLLSVTAEEGVKGSWKEFYEISHRDEDAPTRFQVRLINFNLSAFSCHLLIFMTYNDTAT